MIIIVSVTQGHGFGAETVLEELLRGWKEPSKDIAILAPRDSRIGRVALELGITTATPRMRDSIFSSLPSLVMSANKLPHADVVHGWTARTWEAACILARLKGARFTCTHHDHPRSTYERMRRHWLMRMSANKCDQLICVSDAVKQECVKADYRCKMSVITTGLRDVRIERTGISDKIRIGFLGMRSMSRGFPIVRTWIEALAQENIEWHLYGEPGQDVIEVANQTVARHEGKVILHGNTSRALIYGNIDVLVHASMIFDSLPTVLIEAAMQGIPALASDKGGASQIIEDGITGYLFSTERPDSGLRYLRKLILDNPLRARVGSAARIRYEQKFTAGKMVEQYQALWLIKKR